MRHRRENGAPTAASITGTSGIVNTAPSTLVPGVSYLNPDGSNGYVIKFPTDSSGNPKAGASNIPNGTYAGLQALSTPYTIQVTARTAFGSEVRLTRDVQTVAIPVFQFGVFSANDLDYFAEPPFNFGGRVHSNGNLWLSEVSGNTLTMGGAVTAGGEIITSNLENGYSTSGIFAGPVNITTGGSGYANLRSQSPSQSVTGTSNYVGSVSAYNSAFATMASSVYGKSNLAVKETGAKVFNVSIATPQIGGQEIDMIRRPVSGEDTSNKPKLKSATGPKSACAFCSRIMAPMVVAKRLTSAAPLAPAQCFHGYRLTSRPLLQRPRPLWIWPRSPGTQAIPPVMLTTAATHRPITAGQRG